MKHFLKVTETDCAVKISGAPGTTETITLATDLLTSREEVSATVLPYVVITGLTWTGDLDGVITIRRNSKIISTMQANTTGQFDFLGQGMVYDNVEAESDLVVSVTVAQAEAWIRLTKVRGYNSKIELAEFSQYDDPTKVGS